MTALSPGQIKGRINNLAKRKNANPSTMMRLYMMERFLERIANSPYSDVFILKGGVLITSLLGVSLRSTMDIDMTIINLDLSKERIYDVISEISQIDIHDGVSFNIKGISRIMDEMEYPGYRLTIEAQMGKMITPVKLDISTGDAITPGAIEHSYSLMLEDRSIVLNSYNLETLLSEKVQTVLSRGVLNTRMRDYYDIYSLQLRFSDQIDGVILKKAFETTCMRRGTISLIGKEKNIVEIISNSIDLKKLWDSYRIKYEYAYGLSFEKVIEAINALIEQIQQN